MAVPPQETTTVHKDLAHHAGRIAQQAQLALLAAANADDKTLRIAIELNRLAALLLQQASAVGLARRATIDAAVAGDAVHA